MNKKIIAAAIAGLALTGALAFGTTVSAADERPMVPPEYSQKGDAWTKNNDQYSSQQIQNMKKAEQKDQKEHAKKVKKHVKKHQKQDNFEQDRNKRYEDQGIHYGPPGGSFDLVRHRLQRSAGPSGSFPHNGELRGSEAMT